MIARAPSTTNTARCIMHIGQGFISLKGAINIAVLNNVAHPIKMSRNSSLGLAEIIFFSKSFKLSFLTIVRLKAKPNDGWYS